MTIGQKTRTTVGGGGGGKSKMRSERAGLVLPVPRIENAMRARLARDHRVGGTTGVALTSAVEFCIVRLIGEANGEARRGHHKRMTQRDIMLAIARDPALDAVFGHIHFPKGGAVPTAAPAAYTKRRQARAAKSKRQQLRKQALADE